MDDALATPDLSRATVAGGAFEDMVRALLAILQTVTDLDSLFLARYDPGTDQQEIIFALNRRPDRLNAPEGRLANWQDTLCCHALAANRPYTRYADQLWPALEPVHKHGVRTYLSEPIRDRQGRLLGTLCGLDTRRVEIPEAVLDSLGRFTLLIAHQLERDRRHAAIEKTHAELTALVTLDPLTGVANRRGLLNELRRAQALAARDGGRVAVAFIDLDRFKDVNDRHGHRVGDRLLVAVAGRLVAATRGNELVARYGGDEFVVVTRLEGPAVDAARSRETVARVGERLSQAVCGRYELGTVCLGYAGASVGVVVAEAGETEDSLLHRADAAMYARKTGGRSA